MSFFVKPTPAPRPKTKNIRPISLLLAAIIVIMVVGQLFTFEDFPKVIAQVGAPGGETAAALYAALLVICEVTALPFLLFMRLSPLARVISMLAGWVVVAAWTIISLWVNSSNSVTTNSGLLGATVEIAAGWWMVPFIMALGILAAWSAWGMWPLKRKHAA